MVPSHTPQLIRETFYYPNLHGVDGDNVVRRTHKNHRQSFVLVGGDPSVFDYPLHHRQVCEVAAFLQLVSQCLTPCLKAWSPCKVGQV